jgi:hypothetical protein
VVDHPALDSGAVPAFRGAPEQVEQRVQQPVGRDRMDQDAAVPADELETLAAQSEVTAQPELDLSLRVDEGGTGRLQLGGKVETFHAEELADADKLPALRMYLKKWAWEVGTFFSGDVSKNSPDEVLRHIAPGVPVFKIN